MAMRGIVGAMNSIAIELARTDPGHETVPDFISVLRQRQPPYLVAGIVE